MNRPAGVPRIAATVSAPASTAWLLAVAMAGVTLLGCEEAAAPTYLPGPGVSTSAGPGGAPGEPTPEPEPSALSLTWATLGDQPDGTPIVIEGRVEIGFMVSCFNRICGLFLVDPSDEDTSVILRVPAVASSGTPDTMVELPDPYTEADLVLTAHDGTELRSGDLVRVVGRLKVDDDYRAIQLGSLSPAE
jgi:hypothetical protein